jgi:tRNA U34 2-thiouridine synthase MnmA/TrmU
MNRKAISLLSGGLDSTLATRLIIEQGVEVVALHFTSLFCNCSKGRHGCGIQAVRTAEELGLEIMVRVKGMEYLEIVRYPKHGHGKGLNPCIDCRIFMLKEAKKTMEEVGAGFVITGEVLGQRPMSQHRVALRCIEKESGLEDLILRPLSAKHFEPTLAEREGIVDREKLLSIAGRSRKTQYHLVDSFHLKEFSCPGGGCLLTEPLFAKKLKDLFDYSGDLTMKDVALLKIGRHFRLSPDTKLIIGRNKEENERLSTLWSAPQSLLTPLGFRGPLGLLSGAASDGHIDIAANIISHYGKNDCYPITMEISDGSKRLHQTQGKAVAWESLRI